MKPTVNTISKEKNSITYKEIFELPNHKVRILIKSDSDIEESFASIDVWGGNKWELVESISPRSMNTMIGLIDAIDNRIENNEEILFKNNKLYFMDDRLKLISLSAPMILG